MRENCPKCGTAAFSNQDTFTCPLCGATWQSEDAKLREYYDEQAEKTHQEEYRYREQQIAEQRKQAEESEREWAERERRQRTLVQTDRDEEARPAAYTVQTSRTTLPRVRGPVHPVSDGTLARSNYGRDSFEYRMPNKCYRGLLHYSDRDVDDWREYRSFISRSTQNKCLWIGVLIGVVAGLTVLIATHGIWKALGALAAGCLLNYGLEKFSRRFLWNMGYLWTIVAAIILYILFKSYILSGIVIAIGIFLGVRYGPGWFCLRRGRALMDNMAMVDNLIDNE